tara:strand:+ start:415 stop:921 length:507 start_codon:yes stop_codon:yes gene_type:complete
MALFLTGCTGPPRKARADTARVKSDDLDEEGLRDLIALSRDIVVARLEERTEVEGVVRLRLRVKDTLLGDAEIGSELTTSDFLYLPNHSRGGVVGPLVELSHYLFFLAPGALESSPWIHLRDASADPMPAAQALVDRIRKIFAETPPPAQEPASDSSGDSPEDSEPPK